MRNHLFKNLAIVLCLFSFNAGVRAGNLFAAPASSLVDAEYEIGPENALQVDIYNGKGEKISQKVRVSSRGVINLPLIGEVQAVGLTVAGLQEKVTQLLAQDYLVNPQVTIFIEEYSTVSIMGEVEKPGSFPIKGNLTILDLISLAGGFTPVAASNNVKILRPMPDGTKQEITVSLSALIGKDSKQENVKLRSGDVVFVPKTIW